MFKLDMGAIRKAANDTRLTAIPANAANFCDGPVTDTPQISQKPLKLATIATLAISHDSPALLMARLMAAAMRVCDRHGDGEAARAEMRADIEAIPLHQRADLLDHFNGVPVNRRGENS